MALDHVRIRIEQNEERLSPLAAKSRYSRGRLSPELPSPTRAAFQRDRDRIIHTKAFRRLKHKTQVFIAPQGDHFATRLTHTLEVAQIARSIARGLNLNEDLTEAIGYGHDLGHTPFGHAGEEILNELVPGGFRHNEQSLRVVEKLEYDGKGLNLTWETRNGIARHSKARESITSGGAGLAATLEGQIVRLADSVAYINTDIDDAIRAGIISADDLPRECVEVVGRTHAKRINSMVCDIIEASWDLTRAGETSVGQTEAQYRDAMSTLDEEARAGRGRIRMSERMLAATSGLRTFLFQHVYVGSPARSEMAKVKNMLAGLYRHYVEHPDQLPPEYQAALAHETIARVVCDYVSGMTDRYALRAYEELFVPRLWAKAEEE